MKSKQSSKFVKELAKPTSPSTRKAPFDYAKAIVKTDAIKSMATDYRKREYKTAKVPAGTTTLVAEQTKQVANKRGKPNE